MKEVIGIFKQIQDTSSLNKKKEIIKANSSNELFKRCLKFLLDPHILTGISDAKIHKHVEPETELSPLYLCEFSEFPQVIDYLKLNNTGRDSDIYEIRAFLSGHEEDREFYEQMITKKFRLGCDAKVVNSMIPGLISTFDLMLGTPVDKVKLKGNERIFLSRKLNGTRAAFIGDRIMTRQGKEYIGLDHIINDLKAMGLSDMFIDGELLYKNEEGLSDSEAFQKGTGIAMSKDKDKSQLKLVVFDIFPLEEFWTGKSAETYGKRSNGLSLLSLFIDDYGSKNIEIVPRVYSGTDHNEIWKWLDIAEKEDWEGIMINLDTPYECKRTKNLIKVKKFFSADLLCTGVEEGSGRNKGTLGALVCDYKGYSVNVGSGFTDEQRKYYWENPDEVVGRIVSVKYKEETKNKDGGISIQFPVFESVRFDKSEPSYN
ncbi:ATP-dependent DNA ligase [Lacrimispora indolis]|uniref:ATP-dependent DNA ligase n=1 Tax=Lacrimispora indolis TaxID=69825 RepID=UPI00040A7C6B|nr:hypothetical protein [[Clostridium] methoxybenzovorans]